MAGRPPTSRAHAPVRASVHYYNTEDELDRLASELARLGP